MRLNIANRLANSISLITISPIFLLLIVVLLSNSYALVKILPFPESTRKILMRLHAFAAEEVQFFLLLIAFKSAWTYSLLVPHELDRLGFLLCMTGAVVSAFLGVGLLVLHGAYIYAVDLIEARILLGTWEHPYDGQCFVLTERFLFGSESQLARRIVTRERAAAAPSRLPAITTEERQRVVQTRLAWLDLAEPLRLSAASQSLRRTRSTASICDIPARKRSATSASVFTTETPEIPLFPSNQRQSREPSPNSPRASSAHPARLCTRDKEDFVLEIRESRLLAYGPSRPVGRSTSVRSAP